jgi:hypothetical protein
MWLGHSHGTRPWKSSLIDSLAYETIDDPSSSSTITCNEKLTLNSNLRCVGHIT